MSIKKCPATGMGCTEHCTDWDACRNLAGLSTAERRVQIPEPWVSAPRKDYIWTIMWRYSDNSASGVLNVAFRKEEDAQDMLKLLDEHSDSKHFSLHQSVLKY